MSAIHLAAGFACSLVATGKVFSALPCVCLGTAPGRMPGGVSPPHDAILLVRAKRMASRGGATPRASGQGHAGPVALQCANTLPEAAKPGANPA